MWVFLRHYTRPYRVYYLLGLFALLLTNGITVWIPKEIEIGIDAYSAGDMSAVWEPVWHIFVLALLVVFIRTASRALFFNPGRAIERNLRNDLFAYYLDRPERWYSGKSTGDLLSRASHDVLAVRALVGFAFLQLANMTILLFMIASQMLSISVGVTLFAAIPLGVGLLILRRAIRSLVALNRDAQVRLAGLEQQVLEALKGVRVIREFGATRLLLGEFEKKNRELLEVRLKMCWIASFQLPAIRVVGQVAVGILLIWAAWMVDSEQLTVGEIAAYIAYIAMLVGVLFSAGWMLNSLQRGMVSLSRIDEVMPFGPDTLDLPEKKISAAPSSDLDQFAGISSSLTLEASSIRVVRDGRVLLDDISVLAQPGQQIGVLGTVGSGKSTLVRVLSGIEPFDSGELLLNGTPITDFPISMVRDQIRVVPDIPFLFTRSLEENVGLVDPPDQVDREKVKRALWVSCFAPDEEGLSDGIGTLVGEKGISLSGGQKQRITLARALYAGGNVLILDDILSAVDHHTEREILQRIARWRTAEGQGITLINISNRVSALADADEVLVLHQGVICERGTPADLAHSGGLFSRTLALQNALHGAQDPREEA